MRKEIWRHYLIDELPLDMEKDEAIQILAEADGVSGSDISTSLFKAVIKDAFLGRDRVRVETIKNILDDTLSLKRIREEGEFTITSRKVPERYVQERLRKDGSVDGDFSEYQKDGIYCR